VLGPLEEAARHDPLALVSSSGSSRLDACLRTTGLKYLFPQTMWFSAEDSLPVPSSKPDPSVFRPAGNRLGYPPGHGVAVEDSAVGVKAAIAAGYVAVGNVHFVPADGRDARVNARSTTPARSR
jgi:beta-phosphoglucomutase-like phosphatase (HAD superfamily)